MKSLKGLIVLAFVAIFALTACQPQVVTETVVQTQVVEVVKEVEAEDTSVQIGYAAPALYGGQKMIEDAFAQAVNKMGWSIITTNADADPQKQNDDIDYMLAWVRMRWQQFRKTAQVFARLLKKPMQLVSPSSLLTAHRLDAKLQ